MNLVVLILIVVALIAGLAIFGLLVLLLIGILTEERQFSLTSKPGTWAGSLSRRVLGTHVRRPHHQARCIHQDDRRARA